MVLRMMQQGMRTVGPEEPLPGGAMMGKSGGGGGKSATFVGMLRTRNPAYTSDTSRAPEPSSAAGFQLRRGSSYGSSHAARSGLELSASGACGIRAAAGRRHGAVKRSMLQCKSMQIYTTGFHRYRMCNRYQNTSAIACAMCAASSYEMLNGRGARQPKR